MFVIIDNRFEKVEMNFIEKILNLKKPPSNDFSNFLSTFFDYLPFLINTNKVNRVNTNYKFNKIKSSLLI